jgi:transcriptional regulator with XRE-family HTH domain
MRLNEKLVRLRKSRALSQEDLAERIGVSRQAVAKWESGESLPELDKIVQIGKLFVVTIDSLVKDDEPCSAGSGSGSLASGDELVAFLIRAKRTTYAGHGAETKASRPSSHDLEYAEGDLYYYDTYLGGERFVGEEGLWKAGAPIWSMNYSGRVLDERFSGDFLKDALSLVAPDIPFRGPRVHRNGDYTYLALISGSFDWFSGTEEIFCGPVKTYECLFHGGIVR